MDYRYIYSSQHNWSRRDKTFLDVAVSFVSNYTGAEFLNDVCLFISQSLQVSHSLIARLSGECKSLAETLVWYRGFEQLPNTTYDLKGTPCMNTLEHGICYYPANVATIFSEDAVLEQLQINSYMGTVLNNSSGERLGFISLMHEGEFTNPALAEAFLTILCPSIEEELEKLANDKL